MDLYPNKMPRPSALSVANNSARTPSIYTMRSVDNTNGDDDEADDRSPLLAPDTPNYGATIPRSPGVPSSARIIFNATLKMAVLFVISTALLGGTLWLALPTLEEYVASVLR